METKKEEAAVGGGGGGEERGESEHGGSRGPRGTVDCNGQRESGNFKSGSETFRFFVRPILNY